FPFDRQFRLVGSNSCGNQCQQDQGNQDARGRTGCFFHDDRCFDDWLGQRTSKSSRCSSGQSSGENEFLHNITSRIGVQYHVHTRAQDLPRD
ncbi:unnamed protein product, partial [Ectocarpus sp. 12 AP-2014]